MPKTVIMLSSNCQNMKILSTKFVRYFSIEFIMSLYSCLALVNTYKFELELLTVSLETLLSKIIILALERSRNTLFSSFTWSGL